MLVAEQGVTEKSRPLTYRVDHAGRTVTFILNDLAAAKLPPGDAGG